MDLDRRLTADNLLQSEISRTLESLFYCSHEMIDMKLAEALGSVLEPSWEAHRTLQEHVLFPIIMRRKPATDIEKQIGVLGRQHGEIGTLTKTLNGEIKAYLIAHEPDWKALLPLLSNLIDERRRHFQLEEAISSMLAAPYSAADRELLENWIAAQPQPGFPLGLLLRFRD